LEIEMKKYIPVVLIALLAGVQMVAFAQPVHDHSQHAAQAEGVDMTAVRDEMQKKMASAKTDAERQKIMNEQQQKMQGMHEQMHPQMHSQMGGHDHGQMKNMPSDGDMQKRRQQMQEQMSK
jgi:hypothetical protein